MPRVKKSATKKGAKVVSAKGRRAISRIMVRRAKKRRRTQVSGLEQMVISWLERAEIKYRKQYPIGLCHVDVMLPPNLVVEIQGCYWHRCPRCYTKNTPSDVKKREKDKRRFRYLMRRGYKLMLLWECDINKQGEEAIILKVRQRLEKEYGTEVA